MATKQSIQIILAILINIVATTETDKSDIQSSINPSKVDISSSYVAHSQTTVTIKWGDDEPPTNATITVTPIPTPSVKPKAAGNVEGTIITCLADWGPGRVEEKRLRASANFYNYTIKVAPGTNATLQGISDKQIILFLPRPEGLVQGSPQHLQTAIQDRKADILLVVKEVTVLVGYASSIRRALRLCNVTTLPELIVALSTDGLLRNKVRAKHDSLNTVSYVFNQFASIGNGGLEMVAVEETDRYEVRVSGQAPVLLLADPSSDHARTLLLATSDYVTGDQRPISGCRNCQKMTEIKEKKPEELLMIVFLIMAPHPFLEATAQGLLGFNDKTSHIYIYNQVQEYRDIVIEIEDALKNKEKFKNVDVIQSSTKLHAGGVKNMLMDECKRIGCTKFIHIDSKALTNPGTIEHLATVDLPVYTTAINLQMSITSNFDREINSMNGLPGFSWDHSRIVPSENKLPGIWHAGCVHDIYSVRRDVIDQISSPYTPEGVNSPDTAFCHTLRKAGIPMLVSNTLEDAGLLVNATGHNVTDSSILALDSNNVLWHGSFSDPEFHALMAGDKSVVTSPCDEVYEVPFLSAFGAQEIVRIALKYDKWSPAVKNDPRKENLLEDVPTVDVFLKDLGLEDLIRHLRKDTILQYTEREIAFPKLGDYHDIVLSMVARFKPDEQPGLPLHHDASITTWFINLTPREMYKGGEVVFPNQGNCVTDTRVGSILIFPGELTHPKILNNVTDGVLYKMILHTGDY